MLLKSLFSSEKKTNNTVNIEIEKFIVEIETYYKNIAKLKKIGLKHSIEDNTITYTSDLIVWSSTFLILSNIVLLAVPTEGFLKYIAAMGLMNIVFYSFYSKKNGIYKNRREDIINQTTNLKVLLKDDDFKLSLIMSIEKQFNSIEETIENNAELIERIKNSKKWLINEVKNLLLEEDMDILKELVALLKSIKGIEEKIEKEIKLKLLDEKIDKHLNEDKIDSLIEKRKYAL